MIGIKEFAFEKGVSERIVRSWISRHGLAVVKIGRRLYIREVDFEDWQQKNRRVMHAEPIEYLPSLPAFTRRSRIAGAGIAGKISRVY